MTDPDRLISPEPESEDNALDRAIRPRRLEDYVGQPAVCEQMEIFIQAARGRGGPGPCADLRPPGPGQDHPGPHRRQRDAVGLRQTSGPVLEKPGDLAALLTNLEPGDVLFVDEIHRLSPVVEEVLYPAMEDYQLDIMIGEGPAARSIKLDLPPFTLVGATTRAGLLTSPLRDRFGIVQRLEFYSAEDLTRIVQRSAGILGIQTEAEGAARSPGAPAARPASPTGCCGGCATTPRSGPTGDHRGGGGQGPAMLKVDALASTTWTGGCCRR